MGLDPAHMSYAGLSQAIPPAHGQLVFAQACQDEACKRYGVPRFSFDDFVKDHEGVGRAMRFWLRGAGEARPDAGLRFEAVQERPSTASVGA
eukprot:6557595-Prymnesium_polylepis.1